LKNVIFRSNQPPELRRETLAATQGPRAAPANPWTDKVP
jgi:hypothetical protein